MFFKILSHKNVLRITFFPVETTYAANTNPDHLFNEYRWLFPREVKRQGRVADHSPPFSAKVNKMEQYLHSPTCLHGIVCN
jgi:hypothetical protein